MLGTGLRRRELLERVEVFDSVRSTMGASCRGIGGSALRGAGGAVSAIALGRGVLCAPTLGRLFMSD